MDIGPLNPVVAELVVAAVLFALVFLFFVRLVPRIQRVLDEREAATKGTEARAEALREEAGSSGPRWRRPWQTPVTTPPASASVPTRRAPP